jgi:branched-chain amino acid aminotransferase
MPITPHKITLESEVFPIPSLNLQTQLKASSGASSYRAFFSSWLGGMTKDPRLMQVPVDDHLVHRGDGVFEAFKSKDRKVFLLDEHLTRLEISAARISLKLPFSKPEIKDICLQLLKFSDCSDALVRLYVARGPGGFSPNPYESEASQLYIVITDFKPVPEAKYTAGVSVMQSQVESKQGWMAQTKSCNYLLNVLMKKESVDHSFDFSISVAPTGELLEGPTENLALIDTNGAFVLPPFNHILKGTTLVRVAELVERNNLMKVRQQNFTWSELKASQEAFMIGTTLDVLPISKIGEETKKLGPWGPRLRELLMADMSRGESY